MLNTAVIMPTLPAVDMERAKNFYRQKLGLTHVDFGADWITGFQGAHGTMIILTLRGKGTDTDQDSVSFNVDDIEKEIKELKARGVKFEDFDLPNLRTVNHVATRGAFRAAWFRDSEGNMLALGETPKR